MNLERIPIFPLSDQVKTKNGCKNATCRLSATQREEMRAAKTADNLIMSLRGLMFGANDYHM